MMEWHRVKTILLAILVIVNAMLLMLVWNQRTETVRYEQSALTGAIRVLGENGISLELDAVIALKSCQPGSAERSTETEAAMAAALLGEDARGENRGGGLYTYAGTLGEMSFRPGGSMSVVLANVPEWDAPEHESHGAALLERMGVDFHYVRSEASGDSRTVHYIRQGDRPQLKGGPAVCFQIL